MESLNLHEFHQMCGARFGVLNGTEVVEDYGDFALEYEALTRAAGVFDLGFRGRLCLTGTDRIRFLHGQVTNDVKNLKTGMGCYAALVTSKGRMQSDLNVYCLADELLLDFEPGLSGKVADRLNNYIVADDVQVVDVAPLYGLLSVQGPRSEEVLKKVNLFSQMPALPFEFCKTSDSTLGEIYLANQPRSVVNGFDLFVPVASLGAVADKLTASAKTVDGRLCGWLALETARIEAGIPRFGLDMDETNLPQECGIESRAISYTKGCYIGQEILNRVHTMGHVNRSLCGLLLDDDLKALPKKGDKLSHAGKEVGFVTSAVQSPRWKKILALGYVRREFAKPETSLTLASAGSESSARVKQLPFNFD